MRVCWAGLLHTLVLVLQGTSFDAHACDCRGPATPEARLEEARVVFSGEVLGTEVATTPKWTTRYRFRVIQRYKGPVQSEIELEHGDSNCAFRFEVGESYLVYAYGKGPLAANICSATQKLSQAGAEIEALEKIAANANVAAKAPNGYFLRDQATGAVYLKANEFNMPEAITFEVRELWRFDLASTHWQREQFTPTMPKKIVRTTRQVFGSGTDATVARITDRVGLFWVKWTENDERFEGFAFSGTLCQDVHLGPAPLGFVATCVPGKDRAEAAFVPDPRIHCLAIAGPSR